MITVVNSRHRLVSLTVVSLLVAVLMLLLMGLVWIWLEQRQRGIDAQHWGPPDMSAMRGQGRTTDNGFVMLPNAQGQVAVDLELRGIELAQFQTLRLKLDQPYHDSRIELLWMSGDTDGNALSHQLPVVTGEHLEWNLDEVPVWRGRMKALGIVIASRPGVPVTIERVSLLPPATTMIIRWVANDWLDLSNWSGFSVNAYWGSLSRATYTNPPPVFAAVTILAIAVYWLYVRFSAGRQSVDGRVLAGIFLVCWMVLDLMWQTQLLRRLAGTEEAFAGKNQAQKVLAGPDAALFGFSEEIRKSLPADAKRLLIGSSSDYRGMRLAYYLYPYNVLWQRHGPEIPPLEQLRSGDIIALARPTAVRYNNETQSLILPGGGVVEVNPILAHPAGYLCEVR